MKTYLLLALCLTYCFNTAQAQYIYDKSGKPVNIYDVINTYKTEVAPYVQRNKEMEEANNKKIAQGKDMDEAGDFQFGRWLWYWQQHTDTKGNLVSPVKTWDEWEAYKKANNLKNARITGVNSSNWKFQGPDTPVGDGVGIGRISAIGFHPTNPNTYWIGSDGGGAWKTTNNGATWTAMTDNLPSLVVSDIDINPLNPNTIYICTGDRDHGGWDNHLDATVGYGLGVFKSYDGGATWDTTGMKWDVSALQIANSLLINPADTNCIILATTSGIFKSMNGGKTWTQKSVGDFKQLLYNPIDTNVIYASKYYNPGAGTSAQILRSTDGGETWAQVTSFLKVCRIGLAVSAADPKVVKALASSSDVSGNLYGIEGVYTSSDTGHNFTKIYNGSCGNNILDFYSGNTHKCGGQGQYDVMIAIDPTNVNNVYVGGVNAWYSTNGGSTWSICNQWNSYASGAYTSVPVVHADKHVAVFHPLVPGRFFECNDGGIFYTNTPFSSSSIWNDISTGLGITEFYSNAIHDVGLGVVGGAQDNSTLYLYDHALDNVSGGDGMQCQIDPLDSTTLYTSYVNGVIYRIDGYTFRTVDYPQPISDNILAPAPAPVGDWLTPFVLMPSCHYCVLAGYDQVYQSMDQGSSWASISPVFFPGRNIRAIGLSAKDTNTVYAISSDTNIVNVTFNMGGSWTSLVADTGRISGVVVDPKDKTHIWVTYEGYGTNKVSEYKPISGWKKQNGNLPNVPVNCIQMDTNKRMLYIGTDVGVFSKTDTGSVWKLYSNGLPVVRVTQLNISYTRHQLWASTYGRGMWMSPKEDSVQVPKYINNINEEENTALSPNPNSGNFNFMAPVYYANKRVDMRIMDNMGRTVWSEAGRFDGSGKVQIRTDGLPKGIYFFEAATDNSVIAHKKVVMY